jgi:hypothetical protein
MALFASFRLTQKNFQGIQNTLAYFVSASAMKKINWALVGKKIGPLKRRVWHQKNIVGLLDEIEKSSYKLFKKFLRASYVFLKSLLQTSDKLFMKFL